MYLDKYKNEITDLCLKNKVKSLYVFGSVLTDRFTEKSDIDLVVDIDSRARRSLYK
jgi:predicted nucleotidyltransferase